MNGYLSQVIKSLGNDLRKSENENDVLVNKLSESAATAAKLQSIIDKQTSAIDILNTHYSTAMKRVADLENGGYRGETFEICANAMAEQIESLGAKCKRLEDDLQKSENARYDLNIQLSDLRKSYVKNAEDTSVLHSTIKSLREQVKTKDSEISRLLKMDGRNFVNLLDTDRWGEIMTLANGDVQNNHEFRLRRALKWMIGYMYTQPTPELVELKVKVVGPKQNNYDDPFIECPSCGIVLTRNQCKTKLPGVYKHPDNCPSCGFKGRWNSSREELIKYAEQLDSALKEAKRNLRKLSENHVKEVSINLQPGSINEMLNSLYTLNRYNTIDITGQIPVEIKITK